MKIRNGFVSNSSSSSYVIHSSAFRSDEERKAFLNLLEKALNEDKKDKRTSNPSWGDSGENYEYSGNMIMVETFHAPKEVSVAVSKIEKRSPDDVFCIYG